MTVEYCPDIPDEPSPSVLKQAYDDYLEGMILDDIDIVRSAGDVFYDTPTPLGRSVCEGAKQFEDAILDETDTPSFRNIVFTNTVRSYVYSGVPVQTDLVKMAADMEGIDPRELVDIIQPTNTFLEHVLGIKDKSEEERLRKFGYTALDQLGLQTWRQKLLRPLDRFI